MAKSIFVLYDVTTLAVDGEAYEATLSNDAHVLVFGNTESLHVGQMTNGYFSVTFITDHEVPDGSYQETGTPDD